MITTVDGIYWSDCMDADEFTYEMVLHNARHYAVQGDIFDGYRQSLVICLDDKFGWTFMPESEFYERERKRKVWARVDLDGTIYGP